jgi:hypothetical protein
VAVDSLVVTENLGQVLSTTVSNRPLELGGVPLWFLITTFFIDGSSFSLSLLFFSSFFALDLGYLYNNLRHHKLLEFVFNEISIFFFVLEGDHGGDLTNDFLNAKELVHITE